MKKEIQFDDKRGYYRDLGKGPTLMLLHGYCESGRIWDEQEATLSDKYRLIIPDLPGFGDSEPMKGLSIEKMADYVHAIAREAGAGQFTLVGHSMGGYTALAYADAYGEHLNGLGLFHSHAFEDDEKKKETRQRAIAYIHREGAAGFTADFVGNLFSKRVRQQHPELIKKVLKQTEKVTETALAEAMHAMKERKDRTHVLKNAGYPVLIVLGPEDTAVPMETGMKMASMAEATDLRVLQQSAHMGMVEQPEESTAILDSFAEFCQQTTIQRPS